MVSILPSSFARAFGLALLLALAGVLPLFLGVTDPYALATWLALTAPALGVLAGARFTGGMLVLPLLVWMVALAWCNARTGRGGLPRADQAGLAVAGLFALGGILGALRRPPVWREAAVVLLLTGLLAGLATGGGALAEPWPPSLAARLLDLSPVGFVLECAGVDWMRDPSIYTAAGTTSIPPDLRAAWNGARAAPLSALVGLLCLLFARSLHARWHS